MPVQWKRQGDRVAHAFDTTDSDVGVWSLCMREMIDRSTAHEWRDVGDGNDRRKRCAKCGGRSTTPQTSLFTEPGSSNGKDTIG